MIELFNSFLWHLFFRTSDLFYSQININPPTQFCDCHHYIGYACSTSCWNENYLFFLWSDQWSISAHQKNKIYIMLIWKFSIQLSSCIATILLSIKKDLKRRGRKDNLIFWNDILMILDDGQAIRSHFVSIVILKTH